MGAFYIPDQITAIERAASGEFILLCGLDNGNNLPGVVLQAIIDGLIADGVPETSIGWSSTGTEVMGIAGSGLITGLLATVTINGISGVGVTLNEGFGSITGVLTISESNGFSGTGISLGVADITSASISVITNEISGSGEVITPVASLTGVSIVASTNSIGGVGSAVPGSATLDGVSVTASVNTISGSDGTITFENDLFTPYINEVPANTTIDATVAHSGTKSAKLVFSTGAPWVQLSRQVTFPASGTLVFERWFRFNAFASDGACVIFGVAPDQAVSAWKIGVVYQISSGVPTSEGISYYINNSANLVSIVPKASLVAGNWYRVTVTLNCATNTYSIIVHDSSLVQVGNAINNLVMNSGTISNSIGWLILGRNTTGKTVWFDDIKDGGL